MKMIVLALVLAAAACSKKSNDCEPAITKAVDTAMEAGKRRAMNPQMQERIASMGQRMKTSFIKRCVDDKWPSEIVACISKATSQKELLECESKLTEEQKNHLREDRQAAMEAERASMPNIPGHPPMLGGAGSGTVAPGAAPGAAAPGAAAPGAVAPGTPPAPPPGGPTASPPASGSEPPSAAGTPAGSGK